MKKLLISLILLPLLSVAQDAPNLDALQGKAEGGTFSVAAYKAALESLLPALSKEKVEDRHEAQMVVQNIGSFAGRPGADEARKAFTQASLDLLASASDPAKVWLVRQLELVGGDEAVDALADLTRSADREIRDVARRALQTNPSDKATQALVDALEQAKDREVVTGIIYTLGERKAEIAVAAIALYLANDNAFVSAAAITALSRIASDAAVDVLADYHKNNPSAKTADALLSAAEFAQATTRSKIFAALSGADQPESIQIALLKTAAQYGADQATDKIKAALASDRPALIGAAGQVLSTPDYKQLTAELAGNLSDYSSTAQAQLLQAIGANQLQNAQDAAVNALASSDAFVRDAAIRALGQIGTPDAIKSLLAYASKAEGDDLKQIQRALWRTAGDGVNEVIAEMAASGQVQALQASIDRGIQQAVPKILASMNELPADSRKAATKALQELASDEQVGDIIKLVASSDASMRAAGEAVLSSIGSRSLNPDAAVATIKTAYAEASEDAKTAMLSALRGYGSDAALALVQQEIKSGSEAVKDAALRSLTSWQTPNAVDELLALSKDDSTPMKYQVLALRGVNRIMVSAQDLKPQERIDAVLQALKTATRPEEKNLAISSLAQLKIPEAFDSIGGLLNDESLRNTAALSGLQLAENLARNKKKEARAFANKVKEMNLSDAINQRAERALSKIR